MFDKFKKSTIKLIIVEVVLMLLFLLNIFVINIDNYYIIAGFLLIILFVVILLVGYEKSRHRLKKDSILNIIIFTVLFQILLFLSGFAFGFLKSGYSLRLINIVKNILPALAIILSSEMLRYSINQKGRESKLVLILSCMLFIAIDCSISKMYYDFSRTQKLVEYLCIIVLPSITKNIFLTYNTTTFGYNSSILYRIIMELPVYLLPIVPDIGKYLEAVIYLLFPIIVMIISLKTLNPYKISDGVVSKKYAVYDKVGLAIAVIFIITVIALNSGLFKYYIMAIGSGSMEKTIYKGDAVIIDKVDDVSVKKLRKGDIIAYNYDNKVVVHRIYEIVDDEEVRIITKGDNNKEPDNWIVKESYILGIVKVKIKYIGYPTVWLNESFN